MALKRRKITQADVDRVLKSRAPRSAPAVVIFALSLALILPGIFNFTLRVATATVQAVPVMISHMMPERRTIAPLFTPQVSHWDKDIRRWAAQYELDPNLLATVMQIESCGHPTVNSYAGAQGLFQVMPFHFTSDENMLDPDTNAMRGAAFLNDCLGWSGGDVGLALACYNGGPGVIQTNSALWDQQVKDYYAWGTGIYADAINDSPRSETLTRWLNAGGVNLCNLASGAIGLR